MPFVLNEPTRMLCCGLPVRDCTCKRPMPKSVVVQQLGANCVSRQQTVTEWIQQNGGAVEHSRPGAAAVANAEADFDPDDILPIPELVPNVRLVVNVPPDEDGLPLPDTMGAVIAANRERQQRQRKPGPRGRATSEADTTANAADDEPLICPSTF